MTRFCCIVIATALALAGCGQQTSHFYIVTDAERADSFAPELTSIARQQDFAAQTLHATDDRGRTLFVVEGHRGSASLWAQNMPMNPLEDERCKQFGDAEVDPRQFVVSLKPRFLLSAAGAIKQAEIDLRSALAARGHRILDAPVACSLIIDS